MATVEFEEYEGDVVTFLVHQHDELKGLLSRVLGTQGAERQEAFDAVRESLARHEAAEEEVLRPLTRGAPGGDEEAAMRTGEEDRATEALALLERLDVGSIPFEVQFRTFEEAVLRHAEQEETHEFPLLRRTHDPETLRRARVAVEAVESGRRPPSTGRSTFAELLEQARRLFTRSA
jgi:hypothetical protein